MNIIKSIIVSCGFIAVSASVIPANADPVSINITCNVVASPCTFDQTNSDANVALGDVQASTLAAAGSQSSFVSFKLKLINCPVGTTKVTATFSGVNNPDATGSPSFKNSGTAQNVGVQVKFDGDPWTSSFSSGTQKTVNVAADKSATFPLWTAMYSPSGNTLPGTVSTTMTATFTYQ